MGGPGTLNGYSPYEFTGDYGALASTWNIYTVSRIIYHWGFLKETFIVLLLDQGQVWNMSDKPYHFDPKTSIGIGWQSGEKLPYQIVRFQIPRA